MIFIFIFLVMGNDNSIPGDVVDRVVLSESNWQIEIKVRTRELQAQHLFWSRIPPALFQIRELETLDLSKNILCEIPGAFTNLQNLTELNLSFNRIETFPAVLGRLPNLKRLSLISNRIKVVGDIVGFEKLEELNLLDNCLQVFPSNLGVLPCLKRLFFMFDHRKGIPDDGFNGFEVLETLNLKNAVDINFPSSFFKLPNLVSLTINASYIPKELEKVTTLKNLSIFTFGKFEDKDTRSFPITGHIKLSDLSSVDGILPYEFDSLLYYKLGIILYPPILDLSDFTISENISLAIDNTIYIRKQSRLLFKSVNTETSVPEEGSFHVLTKGWVTSDRYMLDFKGNIWRLDTSILGYLTSIYPKRFKVLPEIRGYNQSALDEDDILYKLNSFEPICYEEIKDDPGKRIYSMKHSIFSVEIILTENGAVWFKASNNLLSRLKLPSIKKICGIKVCFLFLDTSNTIWSYKPLKPSEKEEIQEKICKFQQIVNVSSLFPELPVIEDIFCSQSSIFLKDMEGNIWVYGENRYGNILFDGPYNYTKFTKIEYPFGVFQIFPSNTYTLFIDSDFNLWICGYNPTYFGKDDYQDLTLVDNIKRHVHIFQAKSARF